VIPFTDDVVAGPWLGVGEMATPGSCCRAGARIPRWSACSCPPALVGTMARSRGLPHVAGPVAAVQRFSPPLARDIPCLAALIQDRGAGQGHSAGSAKVSLGEATSSFPTIFGGCHMPGGARQGPDQTGHVHLQTDGHASSALVPVLPLKGPYGV
jgi:hypothetical protein